MDKPKYKLDERVYYNGVIHWIFKDPIKEDDSWKYEIRVDDGSTGNAPSWKVMESELKGTSPE